MNLKNNGIKNVASGLFYQFITVLLGIYIPRIVLVTVGSEANGLISSVSQLLMYVTLLEAGIGAASLQALFSPIAKGKRNDINQIIAATHYYYSITGAVYTVVLFLLAIVFPYTVNSEIPRMTISCVVLVSGIPSVISFFFQGKYVIFLNAEGKNYITNVTGTVLFVLGSILKIIILKLGFGIVIFQCMGILVALGQVIFIETYTHTKYKWISIKCNPNKMAVKQSKNALVHQIAWMITSNTDTIILTFVCGLKIVSIYSMYRLFVDAIDKIIGGIVSGIHFAMGQSFYSDQDKYERLYNLLEVVVIILTFSFLSVTRYFMLPFLKLYTMGVNDINYIDYLLPYLFTIVHLMIVIRAVPWETISVAGYFKKTQHHSIIEACINVTLSIILVFPFGIYGVLIATMVATTYRLIALVEYSNKRILKKSSFTTYRRYCICGVLFALSSIILDTIMRKIVFDSYWIIFLYALLSLGIILIMYIVALYPFEKKVLKELIHIIWKK
ncbi:MAG: hypothetical protein E7241_00240 [Lachnospiraceae bacterium]|nr:hypothetical protein [Lachnospiraceae bacterium]